jgi:hypothetical protein
MAGKTQANRIRAAIWLGSAPPVTAETADADRHDEATRLIRRMSADNDLMAGVLSLCDGAHEHFERNGDAAGRAYIDAFSIELLGLIGNYLAQRLAR